jgi:hypothetical protein
MAPLTRQDKLLQVLQDRRSRWETMPVDVRICVIAATNRDLEDAVARGEFMGELYNLLKVAEIAASPLTKEERDLAKAEEEEQARRELAWLEPIDVPNEACRACHNRLRRGADLPALRAPVTRRHRVRRQHRSGSEVVLRVPGRADARSVTSCRKLERGLSPS